MIDSVIHIHGLPWWFWWLRICLQCGRPRFHPWGGKIPLRREWQATPVFSLGEFQGQRSLVGYSPSGCKELGTTERLTLSLLPSPSSVSHPSTQYIMLAPFFFFSQKGMSRHGVKGWEEGCHYRSAGWNTYQLGQVCEYEPQAHWICSLFHGSQLHPQHLPTQTQPRLEWLYTFLWVDQPLHITRLEKQLPNHLSSP